MFQREPRQNQKARFFLRLATCGPRPSSRGSDDQNVLNKQLDLDDAANHVAFITCEFCWFMLMSTTWTRAEYITITSVVLK